MQYPDERVVNARPAVYAGTFPMSMRESPDESPSIRVVVCVDCDIASGMCIGAWVPARVACDGIVNRWCHLAEMRGDARVTAIGTGVFARVPGAQRRAMSRTMVA